ncbi:MAG: hypothetical protein L6Q68_18525, partial [Aquabacterium sp.]|nr:hypothetical protein [Aquabacterium sp.]
NLDLADNPFYREFTTAVPLTEAAQALPDMRGSGWVRDLREAMSMGSAAAAQLQALVQAYAEASTWAAQQALLPQLLQAWAHTNEVRAVPGPEDSHMRYVVAGNAELSARLQQAAPVVQVFNGAVMADSAIRAPVLTTGDDGLPITTYTFSELRTGMMLDSYRALSASVHGALVLQTRLSGYLDAIEIVIDETGLHLQASALHSRLDERRADNATEALLDLAELVRYARGTLLVAGVDGFTKLSGWMAELGADDPTRAALAEMGWVLDPTKSGSKDADMMWGSAAADTLRAGAGDDVLLGAAGNDSLDGGTGDNTFVFGRGHGQVRRQAANFRPFVQRVLGSASLHDRAHLRNRKPIRAQRRSVPILC